MCFTQIPSYSQTLCCNAIKFLLICQKLVLNRKSDTLLEELRKHVGHEVGPITKPEHIEVVDSLPNTRSGKIMRRVLKARALDRSAESINTRRITLV